MGLPNLRRGVPKPFRRPRFQISGFRARVAREGQSLAVLTRVVVKTVLVDPILVGIGEFTTHFRLPILVVGLGCSLGVWDFCPWPDIEDASEATGVAQFPIFVDLQRQFLNELHQSIAIFLRDPCSKCVSFLSAPVFWRFHHFGSDS